MCREATTTILTCNIHRQSETTHSERPQVRTSMNTPMVKLGLLKTREAPYLDPKISLTDDFGDSLLSQGLKPHYHWPQGVSLSCSIWVRVVPP